MHPPSLDDLSMKCWGLNQKVCSFEGDILRTESLASGYSSYGFTYVRPFDSLMLTEHALMVWVPSDNSLADGKWAESL